MLRGRLARFTVAALLVAAAAAGLWAWQQGRAAKRAPPSPARAGGAADSASDRAASYLRSGPGRNLLAFEASPYLQLHAQNPVDWYPWGEAAFERARAEDKPVFLSVGYSTCYWCHVMEREVFSDPEIAAAMNAHFVSIKVDREERPDVDDVYMQATHLLTGSGGWPNSVFLTPAGRPFFAGTYFPPEDRGGRAGFPRVLAAIRDAWSKEREKVESTADRVTERIGAIAAPAARQSEEVPPVEDAMRHALRDLAASYDPEHGGFSRSVKFPRPPALALLATSLEREADPARLAMLTRTLDEMALGGIHDHLAGGFHRYSTEPTWSIPHFEKMLYDNAQLVGVYAQAYALTRRPLYRRVVEETVRYLDREMRLPEGGFASAQDAEVDGVEGASYVWRREEIEAVLGAERAKRFLAVYELAPTREHPAAGVLRVRLPVEASIEGEGAGDAAALLARFDADRAALLEARSERPQPLRDDKFLVSWNALAIRALVQSAAALGRPADLERARQAARFVLARLRAGDGSLRRSYVAGQAREQGVLDDYAFFVDALLALHGSTGEPVWLDEARSLADAMLARFADAEGGGLFLTAEGLRLLVRPKPFDEGDMPSGNAVALRALRALARATGEAGFADAASGIVAAAAPLLREAPASLPTMVAALSREPAGDRAAGATLATAARGSAGAASPARAAFRLPRSEDRVRTSVVRADSGRLVVLLAIDPGWHVHANPASLPFLIATEVELGGADAGAEVRYPEGREIRPAFARDPIRVYDGDVEISVRPRPGAESPGRVAVRFQACDEKVCLPPARAELAPEERP
jgi:hypothetical protein